MTRIVQKYGGSSLGDIDRIKRVAERVKAARDAGDQVAVVVSAMAGVTDQLADWVREVAPLHDAREYDVVVASGEQVTSGLLALALQDLGVPARSWHGWQLPIHTDDEHGVARIREVRTEEIERRLAEGEVAVVAGFQGVGSGGRVTTLGRGGSDTTAVAIAAALNAEMCEIYTDVDGVHTADPRIAPNARRIDNISYDEMHELASLGAGVMHPRSIEFAKKFGVIVHVRSSLTDAPGTMIMSNPPGMEDVVVRGATLKSDIGRIVFVGVPNRPGVAAAIFSEVAARQIAVDDIIQNVLDGGASANISFTTTAEDMREARTVAEIISERFGIKQVAIDEGLAKVSVVGVGMRTHSGVAARMFAALSDAGVNIQNVSTSEIVISVVIDGADGERALKAVHSTFDLDQIADG